MSAHGILDGIDRIVESERFEVALHIFTLMALGLLAIIAMGMTSGFVWLLVKIAINAA